MAEGSTKSKTKRPKRNEVEHQHQCSVITECDLLGYPYNLLFAIPNGGDRHGFVAKKLKDEGCRMGVPDLFLPYPMNKAHGLFIEMKAGNNITSTEQDCWIDNLRSVGYKVRVCYSGAEAMMVLRRYVAGNLW